MHPSDELCDKTLTYWRISQARNNRSAEDIPMDIALHALTNHIWDTNPDRPLVKKMYQLRDELIHDTGPKLREAVAEVTPLRKSN